MSDRLWDIYAFSYDITSLLIPYQKMIIQAVDAANLQPEMEILDAGCGTGNLLLEILNRNIPIRVIGVDNSPVMLRRAKQKINTPAIEFQKVDLSQTLLYQDASFDVIFCINVLYTLRNIRPILDEFHRILKSYGKLVIVDPRETAQFMRIFWDHLSVSSLSELTKRLTVFRPDLFVQLLLVGIINFLIDRKYYQREFVYRSNFQWQCLLSKFNSVEITTTYADQHWLIVAKKGACP